MIRVDGYPIDCATTERLTYEADVTENEVEKGADITDHVRPKFPVLEIEGIVSDTPIGAVAADPTRQVVGQPHSKEAFRRLVEVFTAATTISVECSYGKFDDMILATLTPERDVKSLKAFKFSATFRKIKFVENKRTTVRVAVPNCGKRENFGLSLDKLVDGNKVLWRKGKPPGTSPATDPAGVIIGQETVFIVKGKYYHQDRKKQLTTQDNLDLAKDLTRDAALLQRRAIKRDEDKIASIDDRLKRADALLAEKERHPGQYVDPAAFGFKPKGN